MSTWQTHKPIDISKVYRYARETHKHIEQFKFTQMIETQSTHTALWHWTAACKRNKLPNHVGLTHEIRLGLTQAATGWRTKRAIRHRSWEILFRYQAHIVRDFIPLSSTIVIPRKLDRHTCKSTCNELKQNTILIKLHHIRFLCPHTYVCICVHMSSQVPDWGGMSPHVPLGGMTSAYVPYWSWISSKLQ